MGGGRPSGPSLANGSVSSGSVAPLGIGGLYDPGFLALGLLALGALVRRLYRRWAPVTELLTAYVTDAPGGAHTDAAESR